MIILWHCTALTADRALGDRHLNTGSCLYHMSTWGYYDNMPGAHLGACAWATIKPVKPPLPGL